MTEPNTTEIDMTDELTARRDSRMARAKTDRDFALSEIDRIADKHGVFPTLEDRQRLASWSVSEAEREKRKTS